MKSDIDLSLDKEEVVYPILKVNGNKTFVVLFTAPNLGVVVYSNNDSAQELGCWYDKWVEGSFSKFLGKVTIKN